MRILWVKAGGLVPPDVGGKIRSYHILRELARRHAVTFFTFYAQHEGDVHGELDRLFERAVCLPLRIPEPRSRGEALCFARHLFSGLPYSVAKHARPPVRRAMEEVVAESAFDAVVCDFAVAGAVAPWHLACPKILFTHNVEALIWKRHWEVARNPVWKAVCWREYKAMRRFENCWLRAADHVLTVSETDREFFSSIVPAEKITVIPTGVDVEYFQPPSASSTGPACRTSPADLVFTGAMDWLANEDGITYFVQEVLPLVQREIPEATLTIVGRNPLARVRALAGSHVRVTGRVEDIRPFVRDAAVYVVPLRVGSGTRLKIFEAMAMGRAVVSTSLGAEGLPVTDGEHLLLADGAPQFANRVVELLRSREWRERLGASARQLVEQRYGWPSVANVFEELLEKEVSKFQGSKEQVSRFRGFKVSRFGTAETIHP
jgi:sugar transferase (PEP-CTERM/EpsH1 system associated)